MILKADMLQIFDRALKLKKEKYQRWPQHIVAQSGFVFRKAGELMFTSQDLKYNKQDPEEAKKQRQQLEELAYETIAATLRFLERLKPVEENLEVTTTPPAPELFEGAAKKFIEGIQFLENRDILPKPQNIETVTNAQSETLLQHDPTSGE
jgi:hypothetical protein